MTNSFQFILSYMIFSTNLPLRPFLFSNHPLTFWKRDSRSLWRSCFPISEDSIFRTCSVQARIVCCDMVQQASEARRKELARRLKDEILHPDRYKPGSPFTIILNDPPRPDTSVAHSLELIRTTARNRSLARALLGKG